MWEFFTKKIESERWKEYFYQVFWCLTNWRRDAFCYEWIKRSAILKRLYIYFFHLAVRYIFVFSSHFFSPFWCSFSFFMCILPVHHRHNIIQMFQQPFTNAKYSWEMLESCFLCWFPFFLYSIVGAVAFADSSVAHFENQFLFLFKQAFSSLSMERK